MFKVQRGRGVGSWSKATYHTRRTTPPEPRFRFKMLSRSIFLFFFCSRIHQVAPSGVEGILGAAGVRGSKREVLKKKCPFEVFEARSCAPCGFRSPFSPDLKGVVNKAGRIGVIGGGSEREVGDDDAPVVTVGKKEGGEGEKGRGNGERRESRIRSSRECRGRSFFIWPIGGCCGLTPVCVIVLVLALELE